MSLHILKKKKTVLAILLVCSLIGFVLRLIGKASGFLTVLFVLLSLLVLAFAVLTARQFKPRPGFLQNHRPTPALLAQLLASVLLMLASIIHLFLKNEPARILIGLTGMAGAACMAVFTCFAVIRQRPSVLLYLGLTVSIICRLIPEFRSWSVSPDFGSYAPQLLASLAVMLACFHLGGFALEDGKRRTTIVFCMLGVYFSLVSLTVGGVYWILCVLSYTLFLSGALWELMTLPRRRRRTTAVK